MWCKIRLINEADGRGMRPRSKTGEEYGFRLQLKRKAETTSSFELFSVNNAEAQ